MNCEIQTTSFCSGLSCSPKFWWIGGKLTGSVSLKNDLDLSTLLKRVRSPYALSCSVDIASGVFCDVENPRVWMVKAEKVSFQSTIPNRQTQIARKWNVATERMKQDQNVLFLQTLNSNNCFNLFTSKHKLQSKLHFLGM